MLKPTYLTYLHENMKNPSFEEEEEIIEDSQPLSPSILSNLPKKRKKTAEKAIQCEECFVNYRRTSEFEIEVIVDEATATSEILSVKGLRILETNILQVWLHLNWKNKA